MDKLREALQALYDAIERDGDPAFAHLLVEARAALAEPVADEPVAPAESGEYPPLPEPAGMTEINPYIGLGPMDPHHGKQTLTWYTADQMRAYVDADRAQRVPLTDEQIVSCLSSVARSVPKGLTYDSGPYDITKPTAFLVQLIRAIERAHGIGAKP